MSIFKEREKAFENKFFKDKEVEFSLKCKQRKFVALWAAEQMHMDDIKALEYALELVTLDISGSQEKMIERITKDFDINGIVIGQEELRQKILELNDAALQKLEKQLDDK